ncbi:MAG: hypothetical protein JOZ05_18565 [Acetobacteraceae bacterium]|nr:hypothetical protein [Acetobacteraceae bacterium]
MSVTKKQPSDSASRCSRGQAAQSNPKHSGATEPAQAGKAGPTSYILSAPKGARTVSHRQIKTAVKKVFRARAEANG